MRTKTKTSEKNHQKVAKPKQRRMLSFDDYDYVLEQINQWREAVADFAHFIPVVNCGAYSSYKIYRGIKTLYLIGMREIGLRFFGAFSYDYPMLPKNVKWHFVPLGNMSFAPQWHLMDMHHGVRKEYILQDINDVCEKFNTHLDVLLRVGELDGKYKCFSLKEAVEMIKKIKVFSSTPFFKPYPNINVTGFSLVNPDSRNFVDEVQGQAAQLFANPIVSIDLPEPSDMARGCQYVTSEIKGL